MRRRLTIYLTAITFAGLALVATASTSDQPRPAERGSVVVPPAPRVLDAGRGEDGSAVASDDAGIGATSREGWLLGKVEPAAEQEAVEHDTVRVIVYLDPAPTKTAAAPSVDEVKQRFRPTLDALRNEIWGIMRSARPEQSLSEETEKLWVAVDPLLTLDEQDHLRQLRSELDDQLTAMRKAVGEALRARATPAFAPVRDLVETEGGIVHAEVATVLALGATIPSHLLERLALRADVALITLDRPQELELDVSMPSLGMDDWWTGGFDGGIWDGGVVDTGVQEDHPAFSSVSFFTDSGTPDDSDGHGTHVAGIIASGSATYSGGAPGLDALVWGRSGDQSTTMSRMDTLASDLVQAPEVINHSLGYGTANSSDYNANDTFYDAFIDNFDVMVTKSAGNNGWGASSPTITHPAPAYNLMAVANMDDQGTTDRNDDVRRGSSSVGPTVNGRQKPDITAPGTAIRSTNAFWVGSGSGSNRSCRDPAVVWDYVDCSGTSMAAPHVAGAIVLMEDAGNHTPMAQKAVLVNTADAWTSMDTSTTTDDGPVNGSHWDMSYGWGYLDADEAYFNRGDYFQTSVSPRNDNATEDDYKLYVGNMFANEKATMAWQRRADYSAGAPASTVYSLADLNLRLYDEETGVLVDSELGGADNLHQVSTPSTITAVVKPYAWSTSFSGTSSETFVLATEENFVEAEFPESFQAFAVWPATVQPNEEFTVEFWMRNDSALASHDNLVEVMPPAGWSLVSGANPQNTGSVAGGGTMGAVHATFTVRAQATPANDVHLDFTHAHSSYAEDYGPANWWVAIDVVQDVTAPTPSPMTFATAPFSPSSDEASMTATTATDPHGPVEYLFDFTSSPTGGSGGTDSGWGTSTAYTDAGLQPDNRYCYRVAARDNPTTTPNQTGWSVTECTDTLANPPTAGSFLVLDDTTVRVSWGANANPVWTEYFVHNMSDGHTSGWITGTLWDDTGLSCGTHTYRVRARNSSGDETGWVNLGDAVIGDPAGVFCDGFEAGDTTAWSSSQP